MEISWAICEKNIYRAFNSYIAPIGPLKKKSFFLKYIHNTNTRLLGKNLCISIYACLISIRGPVEFTELYAFALTLQNSPTFILVATWNYLILGGKKPMKGNIFFSLLNNHKLLTIIIHQLFWITNNFVSSFVS